MKFAHLGDCHLGGWRYPELQELNMQSFSMAIDLCIKEGVDFVLIVGDLFDSPYPSIEVLKQTFLEFRKLKQAKIPSYIIAGSHDYSVSGKTFLDVLEYAGFCKNVYNAEIRKKQGIGNKSNSENKEITEILLNPVIEKNIAIYGYPGRKSSLEVRDLKKIKLQDSPFFKILMLHTSITDAIGNLPVESINISNLPIANYYALGHLHIKYCKGNVVYSGPIFPNNFQELEELKQGMFYIIETAAKAFDYSELKPRRVDLKIKDVIVFDIQIRDTLSATEYIISELNKKNLEDKIVLLKIRGILDKGKTSDIKFADIETFAKEKGAFVILKSTSKLKIETSEIKIETDNMDRLEDEIIEKFIVENPSEFNERIQTLINALNTEKKEDEKNLIFQERFLGEIKKILNY